MPDQEVKYTIKIGKEGSGAAQAQEDLKKVEQQAKTTGVSLGGLKDGFSTLFAGFAIQQALEEFAQSDRALSKLKTSLIGAGDASVQTFDKLTALAELLGTQTNIDDSAIVNVMAKLISFGAQPQDLERLTRLVLDLSVVMDKDLGRATVAIGSALKNDTSIFKQFGVVIDETKNSTDQLDQGLTGLTAKMNGQAAAAAKTLSGEIEGTKKQLKQFSEEIGEAIAKMHSLAAKGAAAVGTLSSLSEVRKSRDEQLKQHDALREALEAEIDLQEKQLRITKDHADYFRKGLAGSFAGEQRPDPSISGYLSGLFGAQKTSNQRNLTRESEVLKSIVGQLRPETLAKQTAPTEASKIQTDAQIKADEEAAQKSVEVWGAATAKKMKAELDALDKAALERERLEKIADDRSLVQMNVALQVNATERELNDELTLSKLEGVDKERAQMEINHQRRQQQIRELTFEDEDRYNELIALEDQLHQVETARFENARSFAGKLQLDLQEVARAGEQAFAQGLAGAIVDSFEQGEKAFQKFAASFLRLMAQMILQALILRAVQGIVGAVGSSSVTPGTAGGVHAAGGGQFTAMAGGGMATTDGPTLMPRFKVLAGEAGRELLTVLARPRAVNIGGLSAQVGQAGGRTLAVTDAHELARGGGGAGGMVQIHVSLAPGLRADIVNESVKGARVQVAQDLNQDSPISRASKRLQT